LTGASDGNQTSRGWHLIVSAGRTGRFPQIRLGRYVRYRSEAISLRMDELEGRSSEVSGRKASRSYSVNGNVR
jgi:hypothetical protein